MVHIVDRLFRHSSEPEPSRRKTSASPQETRQLTTPEDMFRNALGSAGEILKVNRVLQTQQLGLKLAILADKLGIDPVASGKLGDISQDAIHATADLYAKDLQGYGEGQWPIPEKVYAKEASDKLARLAGDYNALRARVVKRDPSVTERVEAITTEFEQVLPEHIPPLSHRLSDAELQQTAIYAARNMPRDNMEEFIDGYFGAFGKDKDGGILDSHLLGILKAITVAYAAKDLQDRAANKTTD